MDPVTIALMAAQQGVNSYNQMRYYDDLAGKIDQQIIDIGGAISDTKFLSKAKTENAFENFQLQVDNLVASAGNQMGDVLRQKKAAGASTGFAYSGEVENRSELAENRINKGYLQGFAGQRKGFEGSKDQIEMEADAAIARLEAEKQRLIQEGKYAKDQSDPWKAVLNTVSPMAGQLFG